MISATKKKSLSKHATMRASAIALREQNDPAEQLFLITRMEKQRSLM